MHKSIKEQEQYKETHEGIKTTLSNMTLISLLPEKQLLVGDPLEFLPL